MVGWGLMIGGVTLVFALLMPINPDDAMYLSFAGFCIGIAYEGFLK
jgi:hypothetical protein